MGSRVVLDQQTLATGSVHWKRTVPYSNVQRTAQTICTGYKENIVVLESGYFFDYLCHWNWFLLSLFYSISIFFNSRGRVSLAGNSLRAERSHWQVQKVTLAGPKSHTRAKMSHRNVFHNMPALVHMMIWIWIEFERSRYLNQRWARLPKHTCDTRPSWVKVFSCSAKIMRDWYEISDNIIYNYLINDARQPAFYGSAIQSLDCTELPYRCHILHIM